MTNFARLFLISLMSLWLLSCTPVYKVAHDLSPPKSAKGLVCVKGCQQHLQRCNVSCQRQYQSCSQRAVAKAKTRLPGLSIAYTRQLALWEQAKADYDRELDWYEFRRDMAESRREDYWNDCRGKSKQGSDCGHYYSRPSLGYRHFGFDRPSFSIPRPVQPTLVNEAARIRQQSCHQTCGCQRSYRACYSSCGGVVTSKKICVKNCSGN